MVVGGHLAKDVNVMQGVAKEEIGGAVYFVAITLKNLGAKVAVVTKLSEKDFKLLNEFKKRNIYVFAHKSDKTTGIRNVYEKDLDKRKCTLIAKAKPILLTEFSGIDAKIFHLGPLLVGEIDEKTILELSKQSKISLDAQGFVRKSEGKEIHMVDWKDKKKVLKHVDFLKVDSMEARILTKEDNLFKSAEILREYGAKEIVLTYKKGVLVYDGYTFYNAKFAIDKVVGRTGRGDTCIGAYIFGRLRWGVCEAARFASAVTSLKLMSNGPYEYGYERALEYAKNVEIEKI